MEGNPPQFSCNNGIRKASGGVGPASRGAVDEDLDGGDKMECTGKNCRSCTAGLIADCVALCCCPCAVVNCFALAFVKVPWMICRKCISLSKKRKGKRKYGKMKEKCEVESDIKGWVEEGRQEIVISTLYDYCEEESSAGSARVEAERIWRELYRIGHLGFGRVSSEYHATGLQ